MVAGTQRELAGDVVFGFISTGVVNMWYVTEPQAQDVQQPIFIFGYISCVAFILVQLRQKKYGYYLSKLLTLWANLIQNELVSLIFKLATELMQ